MRASICDQKTAVPKKKRNPQNDGTVWGVLGKQAHSGAGGGGGLGWEEIGFRGRGGLSSPFSNAPPPP